MGTRTSLKMIPSEPLKLVAVVEASTLADSAVPLRDPEIAMALEPQNIGSWVQNILEESGLVESQDSQAREEELEVDPCLPPPTELVQNLSCE